MKQNPLSVLAIGLIAPLVAGVGLIGLSSCNSTSPPPDSQQTHQGVKITGSGSTYPAMKALAAAYETREEKARITFLPPSQSESGISGTRDGLVDLGSLSRTLKPGEEDGIKQEILWFGYSNVIVKRRYPIQNQRFTLANQTIFLNTTLSQIGKNNL